MSNELYINNKNAFKTWGISLEDGAIYELLKPAPLKPIAFNKSSYNHGKEVVLVTSYLDDGVEKEDSLVRVDERNIHLPIIMYANTKREFLDKYNNFMQELQKGLIILRLPDYQVTFNLVYVNCQQFVGFNMKLAKLVLTMNEPNPMNRL